MNEERLINATWLRQQIEETIKENSDNNVYVKIMSSMCRILDHTPTIDAARVVHGRWIWTVNGESDEEQYWVCSNCKEHTYYKTHYCPDCGAKMDLER